MNQDTRARYETLSPGSKAMITKIVEELYKRDVEIRRCHTLIARLETTAEE